MSVVCPHTQLIFPATPDCKKIESSKQIWANDAIELAVMESVLGKQASGKYKIQAGLINEPKHGDILIPGSIRLKRFPDETFFRIFPYIPRFGKSEENQDYLMRPFVQFRALLKNGKSQPPASFRRSIMTEDEIRTMFGAFVPSANSFEGEGILIDCQVAINTDDYEFEFLDFSNGIPAETCLA